MAQTESDLVWVGAGALPFTVRSANLYQILRQQMETNAYCGE